MNPVENKQPSECSELAMKKAKDILMSWNWHTSDNLGQEGTKLQIIIAKELDSLNMQIDVLGNQLNDYIEKNKLLKSQADGLSSALDRITTYKWTHQPSILEWGRILAIGQRSLEAYRKGK